MSKCPCGRVNRLLGICPRVEGKKKRRRRRKETNLSNWVWCPMLWSEPLKTETVGSWVWWCQPGLHGETLYLPKWKQAKKIIELEPYLLKFPSKPSLCIYFLSLFRRYILDFTYWRLYNMYGFCVLIVSISFLYILIWMSYSTKKKTDDFP